MRDEKLDKMIDIFEEWLKGARSKRQRELITHDAKSLAFQAFIEARVVPDELLKVCRVAYRVIRDSKDNSSPHILRLLEKIELAIIKAEDVYIG